MKSWLPGFGDSVNEEVMNMSAAEQYWTEDKSFLQFQHYFTQFLESLPLGLVWLDQKGCVKKQNKLSQTLLGFEGSIEGKSWRDVIASCLAPKSRNGFEVLLKNGRRVDVSTQAAPSFEDPSKLEQVILLNDVTETRRLQQHVEHEDRFRELGLISATLSHQIKTPLATSLLYADQLKNYDLTPDRRHKACDQVIDQLNYMTRQVNDLLFYVKGDLPVEGCQTIGDIVKNVLQMNRAGFASFNLSVEVDPQLSLETLECHADALIGALSNILTNACEASTPGALIRIAIQKVICEGGLGHGFYYFDVHDEGTGFNDTAHRILGTKAYSSKASGNGIGLRFVRTVAEKHGGRLRYIKCTSGACVGLSIPVSRSEFMKSSV